MPMERTSRRAWLVWITAVVIYAAAVFHRTTLGVAGMAASQRFDIGPLTLSTFTVLQITVYSAMQIPTGLLVDRIGARRTLITAAVLLGVGQTLFAIATDYPLALGARAILGMGDAMTWVSVLRLVSAHFPARRYPFVVSLSAAFGAFGNVISTMPLTALLRDAGWTTTFLVAGVATTAYALFAARRLHDGPAPATTTPTTHAPPAGLRTQIGRSWRIPGTRLGFWLHFSSNAIPITLGLLWGMPYLVEAQGLSVSQAGALLGLLVIGSVIGGPIIGAVTARRPEHRMPIAVGFLATLTVLWTTMVAWPGGHPPFDLLVLVFGLLSLGGPTAAIGFSLAKDYSPPHHVSTATGVVNLGGFVATTIAASGVGVLLQLSGAPTANAFRIALLAVSALVALGGWRTVIWWRRARAEVFAAEARGEDVPVQLRACRWDIQPVLQAA